MKKKVAFAYALAVFLIAVQVTLLIMAMSESGVAWTVALIICCWPVVGSLYPISFADKEDKLTAVIGFNFLTGGIVFTVLGIQLLSLTILGYNITSVPFKLISVYMLTYFGVFSIHTVLNTQSPLSKMEIATFALFCLSVAAILVSTVVALSVTLKSIIIVCLLVSIMGLFCFIVMRFLHWIITKIIEFFASI